MPERYRKISGAPACRFSGPRLKAGETGESLFLPPGKAVAHTGLFPALRRYPEVGALEPLRISRDGLATFESAAVAPYEIGAGMISRSSLRRI